MEMLCTLDSMYKLPFTKKYLVAVSGGPDSMALVNILLEKGFNFEVCHVNYLKRTSAFYDAKIVKEFCHRNKIVFHYEEYKDKQKGNFQDLARVFRYRLFSKILKTRKLDAVVVAHHLDDLIETYFIQRKRKGEFDFYGISKKTNICGVEVYRPFLKITKKKLLSFCVNKGIIYGHDETNDSDLYLRNYIRHHEIELLTLKEKLKILREINELNRRKNKELKYYKKFAKKNFISFEEFLKFENKSLFLRLKLDKTLSKRYVEEIIRQIEVKEKIKFEIKEKILIKEDGFLYFFDKNYNYEFLLEDKKYLKTKYFKLFKGGKNIQKFSVNDDDFPLLIRNFRNNDIIKMRFGHKKVNRFLIDRKIPLRDRMFWPVVLNKKGEIIFVYGLGCKIDYFERKYNFFMLK